MRNILQNPQTNTVVQVGTINQFSKNCKMKVNTQTLQIRVVDKATKKPLAGAHVANISNLGKGTVTDKNGFFIYKNLGLRTKIDKITISYLGYKPITFDATKLLSIRTIYMTVAAEELSEVVVSPKKEEKETIVQPNITVQPSLNEKVKNSASWIWIALAVISAGGIYYYSKKK